MVNIMTDIFCRADQVPYFVGKLIHIGVFVPGGLTAFIDNVSIFFRHIMDPARHRTLPAKQRPSLAVQAALVVVGQHVKLDFGAAFHQVDISVPDG